MLTAALLAGAILAEVTGTIALRQSRGLRRHGWVAATVVAYVVAFTCLALTLRRGLPVGVAYGTWAAVGIVLTAVAGHVLFGERVNRTMVLGIAVIVGGVLLVELGS